MTRARGTAAGEHPPRVVDYAADEMEHKGVARGAAEGMQQQGSRQGTDATPGDMHPMINSLQTAEARSLESPCRQQAGALTNACPPTDARPPAPAALEPPSLDAADGSGVSVSTPPRAARSASVTNESFADSVTVTSAADDAAGEREREREREGEGEGEREREAHSVATSLAVTHALDALARRQETARKEELRLAALARDLERRERGVALAEEMLGHGAGASGASLTGSEGGVSSRRWRSPSIYSPSEDKIGQVTA
jgi:hypothetical protein